MSRTRVATVASCLLPLLTLSYAAAEQPSPSHYEVLSVPRDVAADALRAAYKREAKAWHPDKHPAGPKRESAKDKFVAANEAFATLSDPEKRAEYDMRLADVAQGRRQSRHAHELSACGRRGARDGQSALSARITREVQRVAGATGAGP